MTSAAVAVQALVAGLATGAAYGLIALGFTLVHRLTAVIAFAHGDIVVGAVFVAVLAVSARRRWPRRCRCPSRSR